jgi:hypothetical protein
MIKPTIKLAMLFVAVATPALASSKVWNVTEESLAGVKGAQGQWFVNIDGDNKISGTANMQLDTGAVLTYTLDGSLKDSAYTVKLSGRTDGKNGCVWSGHVPEGDNMKSHGLIGKAACDGNVGFTIRAGF